VRSWRYHATEDEVKVLHGIEFSLDPLLADQNKHHTATLLREIEYHIPIIERFPNNMMALCFGGEKLCTVPLHEQMHGKERPQRGIKILPQLERLRLIS
jgi:hypothetical protein